MIDIQKMLDSLLYVSHHKSAEIQKKIDESIRLSSIFPTINAVDGYYTFTEGDLGELTQPFQEDWVKKGKLIFKPKTYLIRRGMINDEISEASLENTFLREYNKTAQLDEETVITRFYYNFLIGKMGQEIDECLINGKYKAPIRGEAGSYLDVNDGLRELLVQTYALGELTTFTDTEEITTLNAVAELKKRWGQIPARFRYNSKLKLYFSQDIWDKYDTNYRATYGIMMDYKGVKPMLPGTNCEIIVLPYLNDCNLTLFTMEDNIVILNKNAQDNRTFRTQYLYKNFVTECNYATTLAFKITGERGNSENQYIWCNKFDSIVAAEPTFTLADASTITATGAKLSATLTSPKAINAQGFYYKKSADTNWTKVVTSIASGAISTTLAGLSASTEYQYKAYAETEGGNFESAIKTFKTIAQ